MDSRKRWCRRSPWRRCWWPCSCSPRTCSSDKYHRQALLNSELYLLYQYIATSYNLGTTQLAPISRHAMFDNVGKYSAQQNHPKIKYKLCSKNSEKILDERHWDFVAIIKNNDGVIAWVKRDLNAVSFLAASSRTFPHAMDGRWRGLEHVNNKFNHPFIHDFHFGPPEKKSKERC